MKNKTKSILFLAIVSLASWAAAQCIGTFPAGSSYFEICEKVVDVGCLILDILEAIIVGVAVLVLAIAGFQWTSSAFNEDMQRRAEAKEKIIQVLIGLAIAMAAAQLVVLLFGGSLGSFTC